MKLITLILLGTVIILSGCADKDQLKELSGFWVSTDYKRDRAFYSLLIKDSLVETNKYGIDNYIYPLSHNENHVEAHYPFHGWETAFDLFVNTDTLTQIYYYNEANERKIKYVLMDSNLIDRRLLYCDSPLQIDLPDANEKKEPIVIETKSLISSLFIGKLKKGSINEFPDVSADSFAIQRGHILIPFSGIQAFLKNEQPKLDELDRENFITLLHADKGTPEAFIIKIREAVRKYNPKL